MVVLQGKQYSCDGRAGKAIQLWWCWRGSNTVVMVVQGRQYSCGNVGAVRQYSCGGVSGKAIQL